MNFFGELYKNCDARDGYLEIRTLPDRRQYWLTSPVLSQEILDLQTNVFFGVGLRSRKEGTADAVSCLPAIWVDMDAKDFGSDMAACAQRLWDGFQWHAIVRTGGGFHAYRRLAVPARTLEEKQLCVNAMKGLAQKLGGDRAATDIARILRVPGTRNYKYAPSREVVIKYQNWEHADLTFENLKDLAPVLVHIEIPKESVDVPDEIQRIVGRCPFMRHCVDDARTLSEPEWYAWISNLCGFHKSPRYIHEVSRRYPKYRASETDQKILHALDDSAPITCDRIKGMWDCGQVCGVRAPAGLAWRTVAAPEVVAGENPFRRTGQEDQDFDPSGDSIDRLLGGFRLLCGDAD